MSQSSPLQEVWSSKLNLPLVETIRNTFHSTVPIILNSHSLSLKIKQRSILSQSQIYLFPQYKACTVPCQNQSVSCCWKQSFPTMDRSFQLPRKILCISFDHSSQKSNKFFLIIHQFADGKQRQIIIQFRNKFIICPDHIQKS